MVYYILSHRIIIPSSHFGGAFSPWDASKTSVPSSKPNIGTPERSKAIGTPGRSPQNGWFIMEKPQKSYENGCYNVKIMETPSMIVENPILTLNYSRRGICPHDLRKPP